MASERRNDRLQNDELPAGLPNPLPPGWIFRPRSPNASVEELRKHLGVSRLDGTVTLEELMYDEDTASVSDEEWQRWQREGLNASE